MILQELNTSENPSTIKNRAEGSLSSGNLRVGGRIGEMLVNIKIIMNHELRCEGSHTERQPEGRDRANHQKSAVRMPHHEGDR